jgi:hypothetical protein
LGPEKGREAVRFQQIEWALAVVKRWFLGAMLFHGDPSLGPLRVWDCFFGIPTIKTHANRS